MWKKWETSNESSERQAMHQMSDQQWIKWTTSNEANERPAMNQMSDQQWIKWATSNDAWRFKCSLYNISMPLRYCVTRVSKVRPKALIGIWSVTCMGLPLLKALLSNLNEHPANARVLALFCCVTGQMTAFWYVLTRIEGRYTVYWLL